MKSATWILRMYPHAWRERYEEEMVALLEQHTVTVMTQFDLVFGAVDAHLDPSFRSPHSLFWLKDERMVATTFLCAYAMFLFAMYNWHHYIPLSLSLAPYYLDMAIRSTPTPLLPFVGLQQMSSDTVLAISDWMIQVTLLACNCFFIGFYVKQAKPAERKRFVLPAATCLLLLLALPLLPLLTVPTSHVALSNPAGTIVALEIRPFDQIIQHYVLSFLLLCPLLPLLITSLFLASMRIRKVMTTPRKLWMMLALLLYLILPLGRMLWLSTSVQIPSTIVPPSSLALGTTLTYFPPFAGLATMVLVLASTNGNKGIVRVALLPALVLSVGMLVKLIVILSTFPLIYRSGLYLSSSWNGGASTLALFTMLSVTLVASGIALVALMRGFVLVKTAALSTQGDIKPQLT